MAKSQVFFRCVKARPPHPFAGLYAIEKICIKDNVITAKEIVKEWDLRAITEARLGDFGGTAAYESYVADNGKPDDEVKDSTIQPIKALTEKKLKAEVSKIVG
jgi:hypothetical protein